MKINESTLISYATSVSCPTDKEGFLWKRGVVNKNFQKRYFVLKGNLLFYFEKRHDKEPIGVIIIEGCIIELAEEEQEMFGFKIVFHGEGRRIYYLGTDSQVISKSAAAWLFLAVSSHNNILIFLQTSVEEWMKFLASASYDYMKLMVMELQQKLNEQEELEKVQLQAQRSADIVQQQRPNPFNKADTLSAAALINPTLSWAQVHKCYGDKISKDRDKWCLSLLQ
jgi:hypothetical protein